MAEDEVKFHFIKAPTCMEIMVDGGFGGITPQQRIFLAVYTERRPIPQETVHAISDAGELGPEILERRVGKEDMIRIVQSVLYMDPESAARIHKWLGEKLQELEKVTTLIKAGHRE